MHHAATLYASYCCTSVFNIYSFRYLFAIAEFKDICDNARSYWSSRQNIGLLLREPLVQRLQRTRIGLDDDQRFLGAGGGLLILALLGCFCAKLERLQNPDRCTADQQHLGS